MIFHLNFQSFSSFLKRETSRNIYRGAQLDTSILPKRLSNYHHCLHTKCKFTEQPISYHWGEKNFGNWNFKNEEISYLESDPQCIAYILARWPRSVRLVRICTRPTGSKLLVAWTNVVSHAAFRASYRANKNKYMLIVNN